MFNVEDTLVRCNHTHQSDYQKKKQTLSRLPAANQRKDKRVIVKFRGEAHGLLRLIAYLNESSLTANAASQ